MTLAAMAFDLGFSVPEGGFFFGFFLHAGVRNEEDESVIVIAVASMEEVAELPPFQ